MMAIEIQQSVVCPRCGRIHKELVILYGRMYVRGSATRVTGYVCGGCKKVIHWGVRQPNPSKAKQG